MLLVKIFLNFKYELKSILSDGKLFQTLMTRLLKLLKRTLDLHLREQYLRHCRKERDEWNESIWNDVGVAERLVSVTPEQ